MRLILKAARLFLFLALQLLLLLQVIFDQQVVDASVLSLLSLFILPHPRDDPVSREKDLLHQINA